MNAAKPLVTIITVCYNSGQELEKTILSVINQSYKNIEYIIIDGGSTDESVDIIKKYQKSISFWISEQDNGAYDAMNKGVLHSNGQWINYMNAGDIFHDNNVIGKVFSINNPEKYDIIFGDTISRYKSKDIKISYGSRKRHRIMPSCHQSIFCKKDLLVAYPFDLKYPICADFDFFKKMKDIKANYKYVPIVVSIFDRTKGLSMSYKEMRKEELSIIYPFPFNRLIFYAYLLYWKFFKKAQ